MDTFVGFWRKNCCSSDAMPCASRPRVQATERQPQHHIPSTASHGITSPRIADERRCRGVESSLMQHSITPCRLLTLAEHSARRDALVPRCADVPITITATTRLRTTTILILMLVYYYEWRLARSWSQSRCKHGTGRELVSRVRCECVAAIDALAMANTLSSSSPATGSDVTMDVGC